MDFSPKYFGPFYLVEQIGKGGTAEVFLGILTETFDEKHPKKSMYAIKRLLPALSREKNFIQSLTSEAKLASILNHPNIVSVSDLGNVGTDYYLSMEWINGKSLFDLLRTVKKRKKAISSHYLLYICYEVAKGLDYAHKAKDGAGRSMDIVHCDISPQNILISYSGKVKLSDFGIATASKKQEQIEGETVFGKIHYIAPEQISQKGFDYRADIYSFGVLLYESLAFRKPFRAKNPVELQHMIRNVQPSFDHPVFDENPEIKYFLQACLEKNPRDRPRSLKKFIQLYKKHEEAKQVDRKKISRLMQHLMRETIVEEKKVLKERLKAFGLIHKQKKEQDVENDPSSEQQDESGDQTEVLHKDHHSDQTKVVMKNEPKEGLGKVKLKKKAVIKVIPKEPIIEEQSLPPSDPPPVEDPNSIDGIVDDGLFDVEAQDLIEDDFRHTVKLKDDNKEGVDEDTIVSEIKHPQQKQDPDSFKMFDTHPENAPSKEPSKQSDNLSQRPGATVESVMFTDPNFPQEEMSDAEVLIQNKKVPFDRSGLQYEDLQPVDAINEDTIRIQIPKSWIKIGVLGLVIGTVLFFAIDQFKKIDWQNKAQTINHIDIYVSSEVEGQRMFKIDVESLDENWIDTSLLAPIETFLQDQHQKLTNQNLNLDLSVTQVKSTEPIAWEETLFNTQVVYKNLFQIFKIPENLDQENQGRLFIHLFEISKEQRKYPFQYAGKSPNYQHVVFLPTNQKLQEAQVMLTHQILRLKGAKILTNNKGQPLFPQGYANPEQKPLHPQSEGEIMTLMIPQSPTQSYLLDNLNFATIGEHTAKAIGWMGE